MPYVLLIVLAAVAFAAVLGGVLVIAWADGVVRWRREQLRGRGLTAEATVEGVALDEGMWCVSYRFHDRAGQERAGQDFLNAGRNEQPAEGSKVRVVYLADEPAVSGLASLWLEPRAPVR